MILAPIYNIKGELLQPSQIVDDVLSLFLQDLQKPAQSLEELQERINSKYEIKLINGNK